jgi:capsular polysaccharide biosynthesis protein
VDDAGRYLSAIRGAWPWILIVTLLAGVAGFAVTYWLQEPNHRATATLTTGDPAVVTTDLDSLRLGEELATTYAEVGEKALVLQPVIDKLNLDDDPEALAKRVTVRSVDDTPLIEITAAASSEQDALQLADAIASQLVTATEALQPSAGDPVVVRAEADELLAKISAGERNLEQLVRAYLRTPVSTGENNAGSEQARRIAAMQGQIRVWRDAYQERLDRLAEVPAANSAVVIEPAVEVGQSGGTRSAVQNGVLAGAAGLLLCLFLVFVLAQGDTSAVGLVSVSPRARGASPPGNG